MEKLKAKHDHKLTDILKVAIFGLMLILPGIMFLPSCMYYAVNKYATPPTSQVENTTQIEMQQNVINGKPINENNMYSLADNDFSIYDNTYLGIEGFEGEIDFIFTTDFNLNLNDKILYKFKAYNTDSDNLECQLLDYPSGELVKNFNITTTPTQYMYIVDNDIGNLSITGINLYESMTNTRIYIKDLQCFNLTAIYGSGNEPTIEQFNNTWKQDYYDYNLKYYAETPNGTYTTYTDIPKELDLQWQSLWNKSILKWTNTTILKQSLDNFTSVFGITQNSYITNLIAYELIMVAIYIVIDIILTLFKWLTHLIGEK